MANQERRRQTRYKIDKPVTIRDGADQHTGRLSDISSGGSAVSAIDDDTVFDEDQALELELCLPSAPLGRIEGFSQGRISSSS